MELQSVWFFLWGLLWALFFMTDGFDFGIGTLYPFLGKSERDKNMMIHAMGPLWDGNEVWLITAGGVTFAAFPWRWKKGDGCIVRLVAIVDPTGSFRIETGDSD